MLSFQSVRSGPEKHKSVGIYSSPAILILFQSPGAVVINEFILAPYMGELRKPRGGSPILVFGREFKRGGPSKKIIFLEIKHGLHTGVRSM